jgi:hypothetical protein
MSSPGWPGVSLIPASAGYAKISQSQSTATPANSAALAGNPSIWKPNLTRSSRQSSPQLQPPKKARETNKVGVCGSPPATHLHYEPHGHAQLTARRPLIAPLQNPPHFQPKRPIIPSKNTPTSPLPDPFRPGCRDLPQADRTGNVQASQQDSLMGRSLQPQLEPTSGSRTRTRPPAAVSDSEAREVPQRTLRTRRRFAHCCRRRGTIAGCRSPR